MSLVSRLADGIWNPWLLGLFLLSGGYFTLKGGFFQLRFPTWLKTALSGLKGGGPPQPGALTPLQALSTALASTIGTGSVAGVAAAIFFGGPGAVFWMWVSALLGMMTGFVEKTLTAALRGRGPGGPMAYMEKGLTNLGRPLAFSFSLACLLASLGGGAVVQSNSISSLFLPRLPLPPPALGAVIALPVALVIFGGLGRVGRVSQALVPFMALLFLGIGGLAIFAGRSALPAAFSSILRGAFRPQAAFGGYTAASALRYGVARGVFTNEAGLGSSALAHGAAPARHPAQAGCWGMLEVLVATLLICSVTALVILTSGVYDPAAAARALSSGDLTGQLVGAPLSAAAFTAALGPWAGKAVALCLTLFAFTSLLGWSWYGEAALTCLWEGPAPLLPYRLLYLAAVVLGAGAGTEGAWALADLFNALMALPNLTALLLLSPRAFSLLKDHFSSG